MPHFECGAFNHSATSPQKIEVERRAAISVQETLDEARAKYPVPVWAAAARQSMAAP
jgi:hypothetical protein